MAQNVYLLPVLLKQRLKLVRPVIVDAPVVSGGDRFLVIGQAIDMKTYWVKLTLEQVIFDPSVVVALIMRERWELEIGEPVTRLFRELWNVNLDDPSGLFHRELWDVDLGTPATQVIREVWEI